MQDCYISALKFINLLKCSIFLHKYDPKTDLLFKQALSLHIENPHKQSQNIVFVHMWIAENVPKLHIDRQIICEPFSLCSFKKKRKCKSFNQCDNRVCVREASLFKIYKNFQRTWG